MVPISKLDQPVATDIDIDVEAGSAATGDSSLFASRLVSYWSSRRRLLIVVGCVVTLVLVLSVRSCTGNGMGTPAFEARSGGAVWALGRDCRGQLGDGPAHDAGPGDCLAPDDVLVKVEGIDDAVKVQAMDSSVFAVLGDGTVWAWGANDRGQLGDGTTTDRDSPVQVPGLSHVVDLTTWSGVVYAVRAEGTVWTWTGVSQDDSEASVPRRVEGASGVVQVAAGSSDGFSALRADGTVTTYSCSAPRTVAGLTDAVQIGPSRSPGVVAVRQDGTVWRWDGDCDSVRARQVPGLTGITRLGYDTVMHRDGTLWAWSEADSAAVVSGMTDIVAVDRVGGRQSPGSTPTGTYAVRRDGSVWVLAADASWLTPAFSGLILGLPGATQATASADVFFVIERDDPSHREATRARPVHTPVPGPVVGWELGGDPADAVPAGIPRAVSLATSRYGFDTGYALLDDGTVMAWGSNRAGELGNATSDADPHPDPSLVQGLRSAVAVADVFGDEDPAAVDADGRVWLWGSDHTSGGGVRGPELLPGLDGVTKVAGAFALRQDGTVWSWARSASPTRVPDLTSVTGIVTIGQQDLFAVQADGTVWTADQHDPGDRRLAGVDDATALVGAGGRWAFATTADGTVWALPASAGDHGAVEIVGLTDVVKIVWTQDEGYLALRTDGSLWAFADPAGRVGPGPVAAPLPPVADIAVVGDRVYAVVNP